MQRRGDFSERLMNRPELWPGTELYWQAFLDLHADRNPGGAITWTVMRAWAETHQLTTEQFTDMVYLLRVMDNAYVKWHRKHEPK